MWGLTLSLQFSCCSKLVQDELKIETEPCQSERPPGCEVDSSSGRLPPDWGGTEATLALWGPTQGTFLNERTEGTS